MTKNTTINNNNNNPASLFLLQLSGALLTSALTLTAWHLHRRHRSPQWTHPSKEETKKSSDKHKKSDSSSDLSDLDDALPSILSHFSNLELAYDTTVEEANKRRTASYYEKARQAHDKQHALVLGSGIGPKNISKLMTLRQKEEDRILSYWNKGDQSHRAIVVMCDPSTQRVLSEARNMILDPLHYSTDKTNATTQDGGVWIPELNIIPEQDMHITVALPWWWHTIQPGDRELSKMMAARFRQTLLMEFHYPFQIELERFVLLGGKILVALWRCVGERTTEDGTVIYDRHGESVDPFVRLREEIVRCFTTETLDNRLQPITYHSHRNKTLPLNNKNNRQTIITTPKLEGELPPPPRRHTIMQKTPGYGTKGKADGFIHTTLCRLPLDCLSTHDVDLGPIHRLCREASATFSGHRMVVSRYRFIESMGEGGESNPCVNPPFEEYIDAPVRHTVDIDGDIMEEEGAAAAGVGGRNARRKDNYSRATIGPNRNFMG